MRSFRKQWSFALVLALIVLISIETLAHLFYFARYGNFYSLSDLPRHTVQNGTPDGPEVEVAEFAEIAQRRILHPYLGYVMDRPETMGISGRTHPLQQRANGKFIVAVTGGSVANQVRTALGEAFRLEFEARGLELEPIVVSLPIDGFKQPQQLASVIFFLALGAEFDAVVNIDGFNDIVLPITDNYEREVYPFYPRSWNSFVNRRPSQRTVLGAGEISFLRQGQLEQIQDAQSSVAARSAVFGLYRSRELRRAAARIGSIQRELLAERTDLSFEAQGPYEKYDDIAQVYAEAANVWARSSILMHHVLEGVGSTYFHVLQPNQYVAGSKLLTDSEKKIAFDMNHPYAPIATRGYPYLFEASRQIVESGVLFYDATQIFRDVAVDVYQDSCCHFNRFGKELVARSIAAWVMDSLSGSI
ncbi:MAG: hypothetical protein IH973_13610 [Myxococcales bacterium]|nr:hypothetical protein [Myxococcales bacterium]